MGKAITFAFAISALPTYAMAATVCVAPVTAAMRASDHGDPTGNHPRELKYDFSIQIDSREKVVVPKERGVLVEGLSLTKRHSVRVWDGNDQIESFFFRFKERGANDLCLSFTPFYRTWSLGPPEGRRWCKCR